MTKSTNKNYNPDTTWCPVIGVKKDGVWSVCSPCGEDTTLTASSEDLKLALKQVGRNPEMGER